MTGRERVLRALSFRPVDRVPLDLGGMNSTGVSAFAYPKLRRTLGLKDQPPRIHDTGQMLALPERDVLDALQCDVVTVHGDWVTNAFEEPERWRPYDFNGRLPARVTQPGNFLAQPDGSILQWGISRMVPASFVFDSPHAGQEIIMEGEIPKEDPATLRRTLAAARFTEAQVSSIRDYCRRVRESTDRAVFFNGLGTGLGFRGGMAQFSIHCLTEPDYVHEIHTIVIDHCVEQVNRLLPAIAPYVDLVMFAADDQGVQNTTILPPDVFRKLFVPYYRRANDAFHRAAPGVKSFMHCCGAVYDILDDIVACGFDIFNPVQWSAGGRSYREWKDKCRGRIALWGGGVNTQTTLPLGTVDDVRREVREVVACMAVDSGFVFCAIHNLLAEIPPEKIIMLYETARVVRLKLEGLRVKGG